MRYFSHTEIGLQPKINKVYYLAIILLFSFYNGFQLSLRPKLTVNLQFKLLGLKM